MLEAVSFLANGRSFRSRGETEAVFWGKSACAVGGRVIGAGGEKKLKIALDVAEKIKRYSIDSVVKDRQDYLGKLVTVLFTPDDLQLVKGGPLCRRRYLDEEISKVSPLYEVELARYHQLLRQRNQLLRMYAGKRPSKAEIESWNEELAKTASSVLRKRVAVVHRLSLLARLAHRRLTGGAENLEITYLSTVPFADASDEKQLADVIITGLAATFERELSFGITLLGPHRDDLLFTVNRRDARHFTSQGQKRTLVLALKLAELEYIKGETGEFPVLLFDDVFSELDETRRRLLLETVDGRAQTFVTGTEADRLRELSRYGDVFRVSGGEVQNVVSHGTSSGADAAPAAGS